MPASPRTMPKGRRRPAGAMPISVPFVDLARVHDGLAAPILQEIAQLIESNAYTNGSQVERFEDAFAEYCGVPFCVGTGSGLDALRLALIAAGIEPGDEVIAPANTFSATLEAIVQAGGVPVLVDASEEDYNLDIDAAGAAVGRRTRFMLPVHLYGQLADARSLRELAETRGLTLIEDACQAHGARRDGFGAGRIGLAAAFSFFPAKNLGAMGDAGALVTRDRGVAETVRALREHGQRRKYEHDLCGWTARLDTIQALVLLRKLPLLDGWNEERRTAARYYEEALAGVGDLRLPQVPPGSDPVWHLYVVRTTRRDALARFLLEREIATGRHYPQPAHLAPAFTHLGYRPGAFPVAETLAREVLSLPLFPGISEEELAAVTEATRAFFARG